MLGSPSVGRYQEKGSPTAGTHTAETISFIQEVDIARETPEQIPSCQLSLQLALCWTVCGTLYLQHPLVWLDRRSGVEEIKEFLFRLSLMTFTRCLLLLHPPCSPFFILQRTVSISKTLTLHHIVKHFLPHSPLAF